MKEVQIIGMPMKYGCFVEGADKSYEYLKDTFDKVFNASSKVIDTSIENIEIHKNDKKLKYVAPIEDFVGGERTKNKKLNQSRIFLAFPALSYKASKKYALEIVLPILENLIMDSTNDVHYFHNAKISFETFANNGKLTVETMCDYEHVNEYVDNVISIIKDVKIKGISEHDFENEKNAFIIKLLEKNEKISDISKNFCQIIKR